MEAETLSLILRAGLVPGESVAEAERRLAGIMKLRVSDRVDGEIEVTLFPSGARGAGEEVQLFKCTLTEVLVERSRKAQPEPARSGVNFAAKARETQIVVSADLAVHPWSRMVWSLNAVQPLLTRYYFDSFDPLDRVALVMDIADKSDLLKVISQFLGNLLEDGFGEVAQRV